MTKESAKEISKVSTQRPRAFALLLMVICIIIAIVSSIPSGFNLFWFTVYVILFVYFSIIRARILHVASTQLYQQQLVLHNHKPIAKIVTVFEEHMESHSANGSQITILYDRITSVKKTANLMILIYEKTVIIPIDLAGFTKGTPEAFEAFLLEKGIKVK